MSEDSQVIAISSGSDSDDFLGFNTSRGSRTNQLSKAYNKHDTAISDSEGSIEITGFYVTENNGIGIGTPLQTSSPKPGERLDLDQFPAVTRERTERSDSPLRQVENLPNSKDTPAPRSVKRQPLVRREKILDDSSSSSSDDSFFRPGRRIKKPLNSHSSITATSALRRSNGQKTGKPETPAKRERTLSSPSKISKRTRSSMAGEYKSLTDFFSQKSQSVPKPLAIQKEVADLLKVDKNEEKFYNQLKSIENFIQEELDESMKEKEQATKYQELNNKILEKLESRLTAKLGDLLNSPFLPKEYQELVPSETPTRVYSYNAESEVKYMANLLHSGDEQVPTDFFFFKPLYYVQEFHITDRSNFKSWYSFLNYCDTPNSMIESGVLLKKVKSHEEEPLPLTIWLWLLSNAQAASSLKYSKRQYFEVLSESLPNIEDDKFLDILFSLFTTIGANPQVLTSIIHTSSPDSKSDDVDHLASAFQEVLSSKNYYMPQVHLVELILELASDLAVKNASLKNLLLTGLLICMSAADASFTYSFTPAIFSKTLESIFSHVQNSIEEVPLAFLRTLSDAISAVIPSTHSKIRLRLLDVLSHGLHPNVHRFRRHLATSFLLQLQYPEGNEEVEASVFTNADSLFTESLIPFVSSMPLSDQDPTLLTLYFQFTKHALHHFDLVSHSVKQQFLELTDPYLARLTRSMRQQTPEVLVLQTVLNSLVSMIRSSMPAHDIYFEN